MQIHELKGVCPQGFKVSDRFDDESMDFNIKAPESDEGDNTYDIIATCHSDHHDSALQFDIPTAGGDSVTVVATNKNGDAVELTFTRDWFISFLKATINMVDHQHGEE